MKKAFIAYIFIYICAFKCISVNIYLYSYTQT